MFSFHIKRETCPAVLAFCLFLLAAVCAVSMENASLPSAVSSPDATATEPPVVSTFAEITSTPTPTPTPTPKPKPTPTPEPTWHELTAVVLPYGETRQSNATGHMLDVPFINQSAWPTGCESVSTVMLLQYYGFEMDVDTFIEQYLPRGDFTTENGVLVAPHPDKAYIGNPYVNSGFGCYSPVICRALEKCLPKGSAVRNVTGTSLEDLCHTYIDQGHPVLVWATTYMVSTANGPSWTLPNGETFTWLYNEHCLVLVGYDDDYYYFNDPLNYSPAVAYEKWLVEKRYAELGEQAVVIYPGQNQN